MATSHEPVVRYRRAARWFHAAFYLTTFALLLTGWWLLTGHEGRPSLLASALGRSDVDVHERAGWLLVALAGAGVTFGARAAWTFVRETIRIDRGDGRWFRRWPIGALTGRFARHRGHFDPGQRVVNIAFVITFLATVGSGIALLNAPAGPMFAALDRVHRYGTYALTVLVVAHVLIAIGILPGYRGAWHGMHLGGRVPRRTAERLWPASVEAGRPAPPAPRSRAGEVPRRGESHAAPAPK
jgi:formate dehydrogenase subunit gamma